MNNTRKQRILMKLAIANPFSLVKGTTQTTRAVGTGGTGGVAGVSSVVKGGGDKVLRSGFPESQVVAAQRVARKNAPAGRTRGWWNMHPGDVERGMMPKG